MPKGKQADVVPRITFWPCQKGRHDDCVGTVKSMFGMAVCTCKCHKKK